MSTIKIILSDLHLADGASVLECFGERQQSAFEDLLRAASSNSGPLGDCDAVELIMNGDCFDFLATAPVVSTPLLDEAVAVSKLETMIAAHAPFFATLRSFIDVSGRSVTFMAGNHDAELCFAGVRSRICSAIVGQQEDARVSFCPTRFYFPRPDVYVEHGHTYDGWNRDQPGLWDEEGRWSSLAPNTLALSAGSRFYAQTLRTIALRYPFIDHLSPSMSNMRKIALLCLFDPALVVELAQRSMELLPSPLPTLSAQVAVPAPIGAAGDEGQEDRIRLFEAAMLDFASFRDAMGAAEQASHDTAEGKGDASDGQGSSVSQQDMMEFLALREALTLPRVEAVAALYAPVTVDEEDSIAVGMHAVLARFPELRYAVAGHTHDERNDLVSDGTQVYFNEASWALRLAPPAAGEVTEELVDWMEHPDWLHIPLRDMTQFTFVLVSGDEHSPARVNLCVWENDRYRVLA